ncbi:MAG: PAS domain S-box protein [Chloroflexota bacterium]
MATDTPVITLLLAHNGGQGEDVLKSLLAAPAVAARYGIDRTSSGSEALTRCLTRPPHCLLLYQMFGDMTGLELAHALHRARGAAPLPIVLLLDHQDPEISQEALSLGVTHCLDVTMLTPEILELTVRDSIDIFRHRLELSEQRSTLQLLQTGMAAARDSMVVTSADLDPPGPTILYVNPAFHELTGYRPEEAIGASPRILQGPRTDRGVLETLKRRLRQGLNFHGETYNYRKDGSEFLLEWWISPVHDDGGNVRYFAATQRDVTAQREAEETRQLLASVAQASQDAIIGFTRDRRIVSWNTGAERIFGYSTEEALGQDLRMLIPPELGPTRGKLGAIIDQGGIVRDVEAVRLRKDGHRVEVSISLGPVVDERGQITLYSCIIRDIGPRKAIEQALRDSEALMRLSQEAGRIGSLEWDLAQGTGRVSDEWERMHGLEPGTFRMSSAAWLSLIHPDDAVAVQTAIETAHRHQTSELRLEFRITRPDGAIRWVETRLAYTYDAKCTPIRAVGIALDTTERKEWELELEQRVAERTQALTDAARLLAEEMRRREETQTTLVQTQKLEALGQLTGGVAHDFNNLLMAISGSLQLIERRTDDERILRNVKNARDASDRAARLTRQLLAFARRQELSPSTVAVPELFDGVDALLRQAVGPTVRLAVGISDHCWPIHVDPHQLEVALLNLAVNARDAMPDGGALTMTARNVPSDDPDRPRDLSDGDFVAIAVKDSGVGMTPEVQARVLEPFFTTKARGQGTGLGLPMVHGFTRQSGGSLRILSRPAEGTIIELFLPRSTELILSLTESTPEIDRARHGGATILLVEDDEQVRPVAAALLRDLGYSVLEAGNAETAFALAYAVEHVDLVVTDVVMPGADGATLAARLRSAWPRLPVLFITGHAQGANLQDEPVLSKPFTLAELASQTLTALGRDIPTEAQEHELAVGAFATPDRVYARIKSEALRKLYRMWNEYRENDPIPPYHQFHIDDVATPDHIFVAAVEGPATAPTAFHYVRVGTTLIERLGRSLDGEHVQTSPDDDIFGALEAAYRRCCRNGTPTHEYVRFNLGDGQPLLFERLLLPFSESGTDVTHLVGMAVFSDG